ncbi:very-short-patch-repair endonuclease [Chryseobacterium sp. 52]|uniref:endonuclease domain-containing protein n=1 Tax=Chryseobacterium sp. 52 TaxID=2035213 RepID=UPI000C17EF77|nr:endonuclease domain-containing protein [Chryseobacterium sp. 52]PIF46387.1 very-short-patch-repair endonuclease [Chryseobacterium sp. 52]
MKEILTQIHNVPIYRNFVENLPFNPHLVPLLKEKRKAGILGEVLFWKKVRAGTFHDIDFDRQRIIGNYIVDFYVKTLGLIVEIDGSSHDGQEVDDGIRQEYLESLGLLVFRITDFDVRNNIKIVMKDLEYFIIQYFGTTPSSKIP